MSRLECPAILVSMGGGASTGGGLSATGVLGDILILRLFACDGSGVRERPPTAVGRGRTADNGARCRGGRWRACTESVGGDTGGDWLVGG